MNQVEKDIALRYAKNSKVRFFAGQSNTQGRSVDGTSLTTRTNDATIYEYYNGASSPNERQSFEDLYPNGGTIVGFGPNVGSARTERDGGEEDAYNIRYGAGGHCLPAFIPESQRLISPQDDLPSGNTDRSSIIVDFFNNRCDDMIVRHFRKPSETVFIWYQGAEDSKYNGNQSYAQDLSGLYEDHLEILITYLRQNVEYIKSGTPVVIIRSPDWNSNSPGAKPYQDIVRAAQVSYANSAANTQWLTSDINQDVTTTWEDTSHIDAASQERLGIDLAAII